MQSPIDRDSLWRSVCARWQGLYQDFCVYHQQANARTSAGARQLQLYASRVSTVPAWEFVSASSVSAQSGRWSSDRETPREETI